MSDTRPNIAIVDYGVGNLWSLRKAVSKFAEAQVTEEAQKIEAADAIILPGVGTFGAGMEGLTVRGLIEPLRAAKEKGTPILGICLGAQLLLEKGHEFGERDGLGFIKGEVVKFPDMPQGVTIPAIGWQEVAPVSGKDTERLFEGLAAPFFYFVHSYILKPSPESVAATTSYSGYEYCAMVAKDRVYGVQFHPEKSGEAGLRFIENFIHSIKK